MIAVSYVENFVILGKTVKKVYLGNIKAYLNVIIGNDTSINKN